MPGLLDTNQHGEEGKRPRDNDQRHWENNECGKADLAEDDTSRAGHAEHPSVSIVARDRDGNCRKAIEGFSDAEKRWSLYWQFVDQILECVDMIDCQSSASCSREIFLMV